jgi:replicative DNA helicase
VSALRDQTAERAVLGAVLLDPAVLTEVRETLAPADFDDAHREVFAAMCALHDKRQAVDEVTITREAGRSGNAEWFMWLVESIKATPEAANWPAYAMSVRLSSRLRRLRETCTKIAEDCVEAAITSADDAQTWFANAQHALVQASTYETKAEYATTREVMRGVLDYAQERHQNKGKMLGAPTGFEVIDDRIQGLRGSRLHIVAAKTGVGKTALMLNMARAAAGSGARCALVSLEMGVDELAQRVLSSESNVAGIRIDRGELDPTDFARLARGLQDMADLPIVWPRTPPTTMPGIRAMCQSLKRNGGLSVLFVDYLQLVTGTSKRSDTREREVADISRGLKLLAMELDIAVVALSQLSRKREADQAPELSDLRDSGSIEQDANAVLFLWETGDERQKQTHWKLAKNRGGILGQGTMRFRKMTQRFDDAREDPQTASR